MIHILDPDTINKIAAGEVIERPSSVVKELLENAIDAKATAVTVEIQDGGLSLIRVTDNGCGIAKDDIPLAFFSHATSKIKSVEDLITVSSLGFRGEALSSIAAVAQVELITRTPDSLTGCRYQIEGGQEKELKEVGAPDGTTFLVRNLFYNTPVRKKFLKTAMTEGAHVADLVEKIALSHPEISVRFIQNGQNKLHTSGNHNLKDIIYAVYGREVTSQLLAVEDRQEMISVTGFIGKPVIARNNRNFENYFINGRYIRNPVICKAIEEAYKPYMMQRKFPFTMLHLTIEPEFLDVNVHPTKMELRFRDGERIFRAVRDALAGVLASHELIPEVVFSERKRRVGEDRQAGPFSADSVRRPGSPAGQSMPEEPEPVACRSVHDHTPVTDPEECQSISHGLPVTGHGICQSISQDLPVTGSGVRQSVPEDLPVTGSGVRQSVPEDLPVTGSGVYQSVPKNSPVTGSWAYQRIPADSLAAEEKTGYAASAAAHGSAPEQPGDFAPGEALSTSESDEFPQSLKERYPDLHVNPELTALLTTDNRRFPDGMAAQTDDSLFRVSEPGKGAGENPAQPEESEAPAATQMELFDGKLLEAESRSRHRLIGQLFGTYWMVEFKDQLYIIDQHAAHEKVLYEKTMQSLKTREYTCQQINPPIILTLSSSEALMLEKYQHVFADIGFEIEHFGGREYAVRGVPDNLFAIAKKDLLLEMLDNLSDDTMSKNADMVYEKVASMSCKAAVKGNHTMSFAEADELIDLLLGLENPYACPHGRPTIISMSKYEIEKKFKRIV